MKFAGFFLAIIISAIVAIANAQVTSLEIFTSTIPVVTTNVQTITNTVVIISNASIAGTVTLNQTPVITVFGSVAVGTTTIIDVVTTTLTTVSASITFSGSQTIVSSVPAGVVVLGTFIPVPSVSGTIVNTVTNTNTMSSVVVPQSIFTTTNVQTVTNSPVVNPTIINSASVTTVPMVIIQTIESVSTQVFVSPTSLYLTFCVTNTTVTGYNVFSTVVTNSPVPVVVTYVTSSQTAVIISGTTQAAITITAPVTVTTASSIGPISSSSTTTSSVSPSGTTVNGDFVVYRMSMTYPQAEAFCIGKGYVLPRITSANLADVLLNVGIMGGDFWMFSWNGDHYVNSVGLRPVFKVSNTLGFAVYVQNLLSQKYVVCQRV